MSNDQKTLSNHAAQKILEAKPRLEDVLTKLGAKLFETYVCLIREKADEGALGKFESLLEELSFIWNSINPPPELVALRKLWDEMAEKRLQASPEERERIIQDLKERHVQSELKILEREWRFGGKEWNISIPRNFWAETEDRKRKILAKLRQEWMERHPELKDAIVENSEWMDYLVVNAMLARWGLSDNDVASYFLDRILQPGRKMAWKYIGKLRQQGEVVDGEDIESAAQLAYAITINRLIDEGIDSFESMVGYALVVLKHSLMDRLDKFERSEKPPGVYVSYEDYLGECVGRDPMSSPEGAIIEDDAMRKMKRLLATLPEGRQKELARLRFEEDLTHKEIASRLGFKSTKTIQRAERDLIEMLRNQLKIND